MEAIIRATDPKLVPFLYFSVFALPVILLAHVAFSIYLVVAARARRSLRSPADPECEPLLLPLDPEHQALPPSQMNYETVTEGPPVDDLAAQSYVYGFGDGGSPSPGRRPATRPARTWDYVVRVLAAWPPAGTDSHDGDGEEENAPLSTASPQEPAGR